MENYLRLYIDGTPYAVKVARTVWRWGKGGDDFKTLPMPITYTYYVDVGYETVSAQKERILMVRSHFKYVKRLSVMDAANLSNPMKATFTYFFFKKNRRGKLSKMPSSCLFLKG